MPEHRRLFVDVAPELRARGEGQTPIITGYASVFDQRTTLFEGRHLTLRETVKPGAFRSALAEGQDVRALFNHDPNVVLGRSKAGTLTLAEDDRGLRVEIDPPDTQAARDVLRSIERGDISGMSFAFRARPGGERTTTSDADGRRTEDVELTDLNLYDVSVVTYPAYEGTSVGLRSMGFDPAELAARDVPPPAPEPEPPAPAPLREAFRRYLAANTNPAPTGQESDHDCG
jgi:uncharacterized protein